MHRGTEETTKTSFVEAGSVLHSRNIGLSPAAIAGAKEFLDTAGINAYALFPDLDGLSRELHNKYKISYA